MKKTLLISSILFCCFFATPIFAADYYLFDNGADSMDCTDPSNPCGTFIAGGMAGIGAGDTVHMSGTFTKANIAEKTTISASGEAGNVLTFKAWEGQDAAVIDGSNYDNKVLSLTGDYVVVDGISFIGTNSGNPALIIKGENATVTNCTFSQGTVLNYEGVLQLNGAVNASVRKNTFSGNYIDMSDNNSEGVELIANEFIGNEDSIGAIKFNGTNNLHMVNNIVRDYSGLCTPNCGQAIFITNTQDVSFYNNTFHNNNTAIIATMDAAGDNQVKNNTFSGLDDQCGWAVVDSVETDTALLNNLTSDYNNFSNICSPYAYTDITSTWHTYADLAEWRMSTEGAGQDANSLEEKDAGFTDSANSDFTLSANSPLIDAGTTINGVEDDFAGIVRPQGDAYDIGAYEVEVIIDTSVPGKVKIKKFTKKKIELKKKKSKATYYKFRIFKYKKKKAKKGDRIIKITNVTKKYKKFTKKQKKKIKKGKWYLAKAWACNDYGCGTAGQKIEKIK